MPGAPWSTRTLETQDKAEPGDGFRTEGVSFTAPYVVRTRSHVTPCPVARGGWQCGVMEHAGNVGSLKLKITPVCDTTALKKRRRLRLEPAE